MKTLKSKFIAGVSALALVAGSFFIADAMAKNLFQTTYWFQMDSSGETPTTTQLPDPNSLCPDKDEEPNCARQYNASQTEIVGGVRQVKPSEVDNHIDFRTRP